MSRLLAKKLQRQRECHPFIHHLSILLKGNRGAGSNPQQGTSSWGGGGLHVGQVITGLTHINKQLSLLRLETFSALKIVTDFS